MALENKEQIYTEKSTLKNWFRSKLKPTQGQFWAWMDSYWHKGEKLPINTIDGLGEAVDGKAPLVHYHEQYATNDATSLSNENVEQWKKKLDVDNLQFDDRAISLTGEYTDFGLNHTSKQSQFNEAMYASNQTKLNEPTSEGTEEEYPFLVGIDEDGYSARLPAGDLGKNFANTDLQVLENRKHTGSANMEFAMPLVCSNASQKLTNLPNKSKVSTANQFVVHDHVTKELGYADNVINALTGTMKLASDAEKDAFRVASRKTTEKYSLNQPIIYSTIPMVLEGTSEKDYQQFITLVGLNLFVNPYTSTVYLIKEDTGDRIQVQDIQVKEAYQSILTFSVNAFQLGQGKYTIEVMHDGKVNTTSPIITITNKVDVITPSELTWDFLTDDTTGAINKDTDTTYYPLGFLTKGVRKKVGKLFTSKETIVPYHLLGTKDVVIELSTSWTNNSLSDPTQGFLIGLIGKSYQQMLNSIALTSFSHSQDLALNKFQPSGKSIGIVPSQANTEQLFKIIIVVSKIGIQWSVPALGKFDFEIVEPVEDLVLKIFSRPHVNNTTPYEVGKLTWFLERIYTINKI